MIPIKLTLNNFMCYRNSPPLTFNGIHIACICGDNGNGKSALIDAMTWALWGKARSKGDADLIFQGQAEMAVEFEFAIGNQPYRIIRKYARPKSKNGSGQTILDFQIRSGDSYRSITGNTVPLTEQKIRSFLHMDYDTFINSAFLRQGHAGEFTNQPPVKRKEVLASILGLSRYDVLEEKAKTFAKDAESATTLLTTTMNDINTELSNKCVYETSLAQGQTELTGIEQATSDSETSLNKMRKERDVLENKKWQLSQLDGKTAETQKTLAHLNVQVRTHLSRLSEYEALIARQIDIEQGYSEFCEAKRLNDELTSKLGQLIKFNDQKSKLQRAIDKAESNLMASQAGVQSQIKLFETRSGKLTQLKVDLEKVRGQGEGLVTLEKELAVQKKRREAERDLISKLDSNQAKLAQEIAEIDEKLGLLSKESAAKCPVCDSDLDAAHKQLIFTRYEVEKKNKKVLLAQLKTERVAKKNDLEILDKGLSQLEAKLNREKVNIQSRTGILEREINEAKEAEDRVNEVRKKSAEIQEQIAAQNFALLERQALAALEKQITGLAYDTRQHEEIRGEVVSLEQYAEPKRKLEEAIRLIDQEKTALTGAETTVQEISRALEEDVKTKQALELELAVLPELEANLAQAEIDYKALVGKQKQAQEQVWNFREKLRHCAELEVKKEEKEKAFNEAAEQQKIYRELMQAFGKKGVQAMLIEIALPEIEIEADKLLARMTDNRMHIKIETQRESKKGDTIETLDINISDELGTRPYEMFSGGEAFRINFAIRIALSRLLAHRAGAPLPTLIIDEGFGTQDTSGIEKLREAINSIQNDFDKILVITHIEELKDAFPARIDVIKTAEGSSFSLA